LTIANKNSRRRALIQGAQLDLVVRMYQQESKSANQIAQSLNVSGSTVLAALHAAGVPIRPRTVLNRGQQREVCREYKSGRTSGELARAYGCSSEAIFATLRRHQIKIRPKRKLDLKMRRRLRQEYRNLTIAELARLYKVCKPTIRKALVEMGVRIRGPRDRIRRTHSLNTSAFKFRTEETSYWVGFLLADGNVNEYGTISVHLQLRDIRHLRKLRRFLKSGAPVRRVVNGSGYEPGSTFASFSVHSKDLVEQLAVFGVLPRKTGRERLLKQRQSRHIWRGVIDGDGCLSFHGQRGYFQLKLYGSRSLCSQFAAFVRTVVPSRAKVRRSKTIYSFGLCCGPAERVARTLYGNCNVCLGRKGAIIRRLFSRPTSQIRLQVTAGGS
jgi:DNA-binding CsgD family transcriptional regulator